MSNGRKPEEVHIVRYGYDPNPLGCWFGSGDSVNVKEKGKKEAKILIRNVSDRTMRYKIFVVVAQTGDGSPVPNPKLFRRQPNSEVLPNSQELLEVNDQIGIGDGGFVEGMFEAIDGCPHAVTRPHTNWHIDC